MREVLRVVTRRFTRETLVSWRGSYSDPAAEGGGSGFMVMDAKRRGETAADGGERHLRPHSDADVVFG